MNESIGSFMKSGFPLLLLVVVVMLLVSLWRRKDVADRYKWTGTLTMLGPVLLAALIIGLMGLTPGDLLEGLILGKQPFSPPMSPIAFKAVTYGIFFLPFSGILFWLLKDR